jgi:hypothetical protein
MAGVSGHGNSPLDAKVGDSCDTKLVLERKERVSGDGKLSLDAKAVIPKIRVHEKKPGGP